MKSIRALRHAQGWTPFELALKVGVQPHAVYLWESGRRTPQVPQLRKLGQLFELCSDAIDLEPVRAPVSGSGEMTHPPHHPHADRHTGERTPGRDSSGQVIARGQPASASGDA
jgi:DNA-binding XRE family transcriptional regulator